MYDLKDLARPWKILYEEFVCEEVPFGVGFVLLVLLISVGLFILIGITCLVFGYEFFLTEDETLKVIQSFAIAGLLYPITFTIIYAPIALLLAIPVVLYKHVFKLG